MLVDSANVLELMDEDEIYNIPILVYGSKSKRELSEVKDLIAERKKLKSSLLVQYKNELKRLENFAGLELDDQRRLEEEVRDEEIRTKVYVAMIKSMRKRMTKYILSVERRNAVTVQDELEELLSSRTSRRVYDISKFRKKKTYKGFLLNTLNSDLSYVPPEMKKYIKLYVDLKGDYTNIDSLTAKLKDADVLDLESLSDASEMSIYHKWKDKELALDYLSDVPSDMLTLGKGKLDLFDKLESDNGELVENREYNKELKKSLDSVVKLNLEEYYNRYKRYILIEKVINKLMYDGKKSIASRILNEALEKLGTKFVGEEKEYTSIEVLERAIENVSPYIDLKKVRLGAMTIQIPVAIKEHKRISKGISWLVESAREQSGKVKGGAVEKNMSQKLASEIYDAFLSRGTAFAKKIQFLKTGFYNFAYAHYSW
jgi:small subunit ribosomal protein S7